MYFSEVTWINGEKSGEINSDAFIGDILAKVILISYPGTSVTDTSAMFVNVKSIRVKNAQQEHRGFLENEWPWFL